MIIDGGKGVLCMTALSAEAAEDGKFWCEFYPVQAVLDLRESSHLVGHPLLDCPLEDDPGGGSIAPMGEYIRPGDAAKIQKWLELKFYVALRLVRDRKGRQRVGFTRRLPGAYLTEEEQFWMKAVSESSVEFADKVAAIEAMGEWSQGLAESVKKSGRVKRKKERKDRQRERQRARRRQHRGR
jgi:hypothetical protein